MWENVQERQSKNEKWTDHISRLSIEKREREGKNWIIIIIIIRMMFERGVWMYAHLQRCPCVFVKRFQSLFYISFFLITCVHLTYRHMYVISIWKGREREKKRVDLQLLYWSSFRTISRPIMWNKSSQAHDENEREREKRKFFFTLWMHIFIKYTYYIGRQAHLM